MLKLELERAITKGKLQISDDLDETKLELSNTKKEVKRLQDEGNNVTRALRSHIEKQLLKNIEKITMPYSYSFLGNSNSYYYFISNIQLYSFKF